MRKAITKSFFANAVSIFAQHTRNTRSRGAGSATYLAFAHIIDASHVQQKHLPVCDAGVAVGADGLMIEVHCKPEKRSMVHRLTLDEFER